MSSRRSEFDTRAPEICAGRVEALRSQLCHASNCSGTHQLGRTLFFFPLAFLVPPSFRRARAWCRVVILLMSEN